jgi:hypothetical protein
MFGKLSKELAPIETRFQQNRQCKNLLGLLTIKQI